MHGYVCICLHISITKLIYTVVIHWVWQVLSKIFVISLWLPSVPCDFLVYLWLGYKGFSYSVSTKEAEKMCSCLLLQAGHSFPIILTTAIGGSFLSYIYSAPPLKVQQYENCHMIRMLTWNWWLLLLAVCYGLGDGCMIWVFLNHCMLWIQYVK